MFPFFKCAHPFQPGRYAAYKFSSSVSVLANLLPGMNQLIYFETGGQLLFD
jgi:hypothetical protein